jgi:hypothetical protein
MRDGTFSSDVCERSGQCFTEIALDEMRRIGPTARMRGKVAIKDKDFSPLEPAAKMIVRAAAAEPSSRTNPGTRATSSTA